MTPPPLCPCARSEAKAALGQRLGEGIATNLVSSLIGSVGATLATQPMDVVRTFVQLQSAEAAKASGKVIIRNDTNDNICDGWLVSIGGVLVQLQSAEAAKASGKVIGDIIDGIVVG